MRGRRGSGASGRLERVDDLQAAELEVANVSRGDGEAMGSGDGGDLAVEDAHRASGASSQGHDPSVEAGRPLVERDHSAGEAFGHEASEAILEGPPPAALWQDLEAVVNLGGRDGRKVELRRRAFRLDGIDSSGKMNS
jgi:hypothetical protein